MSQDDALQVVILGAGAIGQAFAAVFADAGARVTLAEPDPERRADVPAGIALQREAIELAGLWRGGGGRVTPVADAGGALGGADLVVECGPEDLDVKQAIFATLLAGCGPGAVIGTASSAITMSRILPEASDQARCLVMHPVNPPSVLRLIELVPAPGTSPEAVARATAILEASGFRAVRLSREVEGFVVNRLQGAVLREAYRLVGEGVTDVAGIEAAVTQGLGPRWALSGPFETAQLNTPGGIPAHAARMGPAYARMGAERGEVVDWSAALVEQVAEARQAALPDAARAARVAWRARAVARLVALRDRLAADG